MIDLFVAIPASLWSRRVQLAQCIDATGAVFLPSTGLSLHPYTAACLGNGSAPFHVSPQRSIESMQDLFPELRNTVSGRGLATVTPDTHLTPWFRGTISARIAKTDANLLREFRGVMQPRNPLFGGMVSGQSAAESQRLSAVYTSIRENGFRRARRRRDSIQGVVLKRGRDTRFLVMAGKHRVAALAALRAQRDAGSDGTPTDRRYPDRIPVRLRHPAFVRRRDVDTWPLVASGFWPRDAALAYFDRLFEGRSCFDVSPE